MSSVAAAAPASARRTAPGWAYQAVPAPPPNVPHSEFDDLACPTGAFCMAVGRRLDGNGYMRALAETWDGRTWRIGAPLEVPGVSTLSAVSCVDRSWCVALGSGRALLWKSGRWTATGVDNGPRAHLAEARCASRTDCLMIGALALTPAAAQRGAYREAAAWHWDGTRWHRVHVVGPAQVSLAAVDCGARASCHVVGTFHASTAPRSRALVEYWNGHALRPVRLAQVTAGRLYSIDCPRTFACTASGAAPAPANGSSPPALIADLANGRWTMTHPALGGDYATLGPVSCRSLRVCTVVISKLGASGDEVWTVAARGSTGPFRESRKHYSGLFGVSCSAAACTVVGRSVADNRGAGDITWRDRPVALRGVGVNLVAQQVPAPPGSTDRSLSSVSCVPGGFCVATTDDVGGTKRSAVYLRRGGHWEVVHVTGGSEPTGVSCVSATFCMAVGHRHSLRWQGSAWTSDAMPTPDGPDNDSMAGVSCVAANWCDAVGTTGNEAIQRAALIEHWDGSVWHVMPAPTLPGAHAATTLVAVSCTSTSFCLAVGHDVSSRTPLVESWNGTMWSIVTGPRLPAKADLTAVSCWAARRCALASQTGRPLPFTAEWNGSRFRRTTFTAPAAPVHVELSGLSCSSATDCVAVGADNQHLVPLVEHWDGQKWTIAEGQRTHARQGAFRAVSCLRGGCTAVGDVYRNIFVGTAAVVR